MSLQNFFKNIDTEVSTVISSNFKVQVIDTNYVPNFNDSSITYDNLDQKNKKCKILKSCVLYVDMRDSSKISAAKRPRTLAKIYSSFVKSMIEAAEYYNGNVRNIIGDRVMVIFNKQNCFQNAVSTAILMNSISQHILNKRIKSLYGINFSCGIGIDYGTMLVTKVGKIKRGKETVFSRSLVWLGEPANIASRLTDIANKRPPSKLKKNKSANSSRGMSPSPKKTAKKNTTSSSNKYSPILITQAVYEGLQKENPNDNSLKQHLWKKESVKVRDYDGKVLGGDIIFTEIKNI